MTADATLPDENPYQSPQAAANLIAPQATVEIRGEIHESDYNKALRKTRTIVLMLVSAFLMIAITGLTSRTWANTLPTLMLGGIFLMVAYRNWRIGRRYLNNFGGATGPISGRLTATELELATDDFHSFRKFKDLTYVKITNEAAVLSFDWPAARFRVLPYRLFDDPATGKAILSAAEQKVQKRSFSLFDDRLREPPETTLQAAAPQSTTFAGPVLWREVNQIMTHAARWAWVKVFCSLNILTMLFAIFALTRDPTSPFLIFVTVFIAILLNYRLLIATRQVRSASPTDVVLNGTGWISDDSLYYASSIGGSITQWAYYESAWIGEELIGLECPGKAKLHVILARRQFASDEAWERCVAIVRTRISQVREL